MKKNLNMPKTDFPMKANSLKKESDLVKLWEDLDLVNLRNEQNTGEMFILHDGPPFANGNPHIGHVLNKILKDMVVKYHLMKGDKVHFRPGFDCHGLPIEMAVQKKFGKLDTTVVRQKCHEWAAEVSKNQMDVMKSFGIFADWKNPYFTMSKDYETKQLEVLYHLLNKKIIYTDSRPIYYSPSSRTVLAEAELEYKFRKDLSVYFTFDLEDGRKLLVWTTQPWTLLGNVASCVNPDFDYVDVKLNDVTYVLVKEKLDLLPGGELLRQYKGRDLQGLTYTSSMGLNGKVVCDELVTSTDGTGVLHLCPGHGEEDFDICKRNGLYGYDLTDLSGNLLGTDKFCLDEGSEMVVSQMGNMLFKSEYYNHSYPHDWRTGKPVYFKLTKQFFVDLTSLKLDASAALSDVTFSDKKWKERLLKMVGTRDRWCVSRQRKWGFPLAVFLKDGQPFLDKELETHLIDLFSKFGSNVWFDKSEDDLLPDKFKNLGLVKCNDTLDVWFDSGSSWHCAVGNTSDMYFEGHDQHRGWFQSSLLLSVAMTGKAPYKQVWTHGFVLDGKGRKMSKSLGNVIDPQVIQKKYNNDIIRLWVFMSNYDDDVQLSDKTLKSCGECYFRFRNTLRYLLGNMYGYNSGECELREKDLVAIKRCQLMYDNVLSCYSKMDLRQAFDEIMTWMLEFSSQYIDNDTRTYLYEYDLESKERQRCQYVLKHILELSMKALAPMCPFLAEEAYQHYLFKTTDSVFLEKL